MLAFAGCTCATAGRELLLMVIKTPLLATPLTVTTTFPVVAPVGTDATIDVALQFAIVVATVPLNVRELVP